MNLCAEVMAYSSVVGSGVLIVGNRGKGPMVGQIAYLCHTDTLRDKGLQIAMSEAIAKALNELFAAPEALAASPEVAKLIADAVAAERERLASKFEAEDHHWGQAIAAAIRSEATK